jgi:hypothetical protein
MKDNMKSKKRELIPDPEEVWEKYRNMVYEEPMPAEQERELQITFYAGIESAYRVVDKLINPDLSEMDTYRAFQDFRKRVLAAAAMVSLDRANGQS